MNLDTDMQAVIDQFADFNAPPIETLDYSAARNSPTLKNAVEEMASKSATVRTMNVALPTLPETVGMVKHITIPTPDGELLARVFAPDVAKSDLPLPVVVYFHGGGWVIADLNVYEPSCRALCNSLEAIVVSVAYRLSPEVKYPAAVNDAYAATQWIMENAAQMGGDPNRVAVAGESAGGNAGGGYLPEDARRRRTNAARAASYLSGNRHGDEHGVLSGKRQRQAAQLADDGLVFQVLSRKRSAENGKIRCASARGRFERLAARNHNHGGKRPASRRRRSVCGCAGKRGRRG